MTSYRVEYTEVLVAEVVTDILTEQCDTVRGTLEDVRAYLDSRPVWGKAPITIIEFTQSDDAGRIVPASEWDI